MEENKVLIQNFNNFLSDLENLVNKLEVDFTGSADEPDYDNLLINMSFDIHEENKIEQLIRFVRDNMTNNFPVFIGLQAGKYPLAVNKSYIISSSLWSVEIYYSQKWKLIDDTQP